MSSQWKPEIEYGNLVKRWLRILVATPNRQRAKRRAIPGLVGYYWDGGAPKPHGIREINSTGLYIVTDQHWYPGTLVMLTLQRNDYPAGDPDRSIIVLVKVIWLGIDGFKVTFVWPEGIGPTINTVNKKALDRFLEGLQANQNKP